MFQCADNSSLYRLLSVLTRITQNILNIEKRLTFQFLLYCLYSIIGLFFCYNYRKIFLFKGMSGAVMFKQTQTPFDVQGNWLGVKGGVWLSELASNAGVTFHRRPEKWCMRYPLW